MSLVNVRMEFERIMKRLDELTLDDSGETKGHIGDGEHREIRRLEARLGVLSKQIDIEKRLGDFKTWLWTPTSEPVTRYESVQRTDGTWGGFGEFLQAVVIAGDGTRSVDSRLQTRTVQGMQEGLGSDGGFLVGETYAQELITSIFQAGQLGNLCKKYKVPEGSNSIKIPAIDEAARTDQSRWGGLLSYKVSEGASVTASYPKLRQVTLEPTKWACLVYLSEELAVDQTNLERYVEDLVIREFSFRVDDTIINGTGAGEGLGILNSPCLVSVAKEVGQPNYSLHWENVKKMYARLAPGCERGAVWLIQPELRPELYGLYQAVGTGGVPVYMPAQSAAGRPFDTLMGKRIIWHESCAAAGSKGDIILADLSHMLYADKQMASASSIHVQFTTDQRVLRFTYRYDHTPDISTSITPYKGSDELSCFISLAARS